MPDFWQFPTGSMGLGPLTAIYQARFMRYLRRPRRVLDTKGRKVWAFVGDGEMDEPESLAGLSLAAREGLDNLVFVVNCNLQRLDGPVRGNGSIVQELEGLFAGAGWNVIKLLWGRDWDPLFARDDDGVHPRSACTRRWTASSRSTPPPTGASTASTSSTSTPSCRQLVAHLSDDDIDRLSRGGHDPVKIYAAYHAAVAPPGRPTVILAQTKKGYGMGHWGQGKMGSHQQKKLDDDALLAFRDRFALPLTDDDVRRLRFYKPARRQPGDALPARAARALGGYLPARQRRASAVPSPALASSRRLRALVERRGEREQSTTMVFVQHADAAAARPDASAGTSCRSSPTRRAPSACRRCSARWRSTRSRASSTSPRTATSCSTTRRRRTARSSRKASPRPARSASWIAAATSYSTHGVPMLPFYIFYSCFGFQRVGDLIWAPPTSARAAS